MDEWEAMASPRTAASYYMQRGAVSVSGSGTQLDSPMSAHGVNASAGILKGEPNASAELSVEVPDASAGVSEEEPVRRKRGRPRKRGLSQGEPEVSQGEPVASEPNVSARLSGEPVRKKVGRPRKLELSEEEPDASAGGLQEEPKSPPGPSQEESVRRKRGRPRKRELSQEEPDASAGVSEEEPKSPPGLSQGECVKRKRGRPRKRERSPEEPDASAGVSEEPNAPVILSQGEPARRKPGRPRKRNSAGSAFQPDSSSPISAHGVNDSAGVSEVEPVWRRKVKRTRKYVSDGKRRPGRPRKSGIDWTVSAAGNSAGSAFQLDSSPPILAHGVNASASEPVRRRPGRPRKNGLSFISPPPPPPPSHGEWLSGSAGMGLTPDIITIAVGEDIAKKVMSFLQQGPRVVCVLSANGAVSTVTLRQPSTSSDTVKYEGHYEILWLSGSYMLTGNDGSCSRTGGLSVSLCSHDGQVICGAVDEMLVAATPVQVIVGSFMCSCSKTKPAVVVTISESSVNSESSVDGDKSVTPTDHPSGDKSVTPIDHPSQSGDKSVTPTDHPSGDKSVTPTDHPSQSGDKSVTPTDHPSGDKSVTPTDYPSQSGDKSVTPNDHPSGDESVPPTSIPPSSNQNLRE